MAAEWLGWLLRSALALAVVVCVVMALRPLWRRWLGAGAVLWLYLLLPAALVATSLPGPRLVRDEPSVAITMQSTPEAELVPTSTTAVSIASAEHQSASRQGVSPPERLLPKETYSQASVLTFGLVAWAAGVFALAGMLLHQQRRFHRRLGHLRLRDTGLWQASADDIGPVVIGLLRPRIVVPSDFDDRYDPQQRELVLAHERVHLSRGDLPVNALACVFRCLFWFNPLVHLAAAKLRLDQELACDAVVLARNPRAGRAYATALLNTQLADLGLPVGCAWQSSHFLTWRISMLKRPLLGPARLMLGAGLAVLTSSAAAAVLWQQQPATLVTLPAIAFAATPPTLPPLPALGRVRVPYPERVMLPARAVAPAAAPLASTPALHVAAATGTSVALASASAPLAAITVALAAEASTLVAPQAAPRHAVAARAPLTLPAPRTFIEPPDRVPLPLPPTPRGKISAPEPRVSSVAGTGPAAEGDRYLLPRVLTAKPARSPGGARLSPPQVAVVTDGLVLRVSLDAKGKLVDAQVHENLLGPAHARNALSAIKRWRFEPARLAGQAVPSTVLVPMWFEWNDGGVEAMKSNQLSHPTPYPRSPPQAIAGH